MRRIKHVVSNRRRNLAFERSLFIVNPDCRVAEPATVNGVINRLSQGR
jgi:hypothetical protein